MKFQVRVMECVVRSVTGDEDSHPKETSIKGLAAAPWDEAAGDSREAWIWGGQRVFYAEFDEQRTKRVIVKVLEVGR